MNGGLCESLACSKGHAEAEGGASDWSTAPASVTALDRKCYHGCYTRAHAHPAQPETLRSDQTVCKQSVVKPSARDLCTSRRNAGL